VRAVPPPPTSPDPDDQLAVRAAVALLPHRQRAALVLRYYADLSVAEVAEALECAPGTVKSLTSKGVAGLRRRLGDAVAVDLPDHPDLPDEPDAPATAEVDDRA
jgi:DNA-directed RNA polymerase specialized sigma24 family protein